MKHDLIDVILDLSDYRHLHNNYHSVPVKIIINDHLTVWYTFSGPDLSVG